MPFLTSFALIKKNKIMKKLFLILAVILPTLAWSQADTVKKWQWTGITGINLNQASFTNWTAGGVNSVAFSALGKYTGNYKKDKLTWNNNLNLQYGMLKEKGESLTKNEDLIELISTLGYSIAKKWSAAGYVSFRTQFADGFDEDNDSIRISTFMAPAYLTLSPAFRYEPNDWFYLLLSPATAKITFVTDQDLADLGSFGVKPAEKNENGDILVSGEKTLVYLGPFLEAYMKKEVAKNLTYESRFNVLYTFMNRDNLESYDADVSWENFLNYNIAKYFSVSLFLHFVYLPGQPAISFDTYDGAVTVNAEPNRRIQIKETLGIGITYSFPEATE
jgi:hypothetical protein